MTQYIRRPAITGRDGSEEPTVGVGAALDSGVTYPTPVDYPLFVFADDDFSTGGAWKAGGSVINPSSPTPRGSLAPTEKAYLDFDHAFAGSDGLGSDPDPALTLTVFVWTAIRDDEDFSAATDGSAEAQITIGGLTFDFDTFPVDAVELSQASAPVTISPGDRATVVAAWIAKDITGWVRADNPDPDLHVQVSEFFLVLDTGEADDWPLRVVDAGGPAYRIGPDWNPDGGLLRFVDPASGRAWRQGVGEAGGSHTVSTTVFATGSPLSVALAPGDSETFTFDDFPFIQAVTDLGDVTVGAQFYGTATGQSRTILFSPVCGGSVKLPSGIVNPWVGPSYTDSSASPTVRDVGFTLIEGVHTADGFYVEDDFYGFALTVENPAASSDTITIRRPYLLITYTYDDSVVARPLRYFDPVLGVVTTLPMILDA